MLISLEKHLNGSYLFPTVDKQCKSTILALFTCSLLCDDLRLGPGSLVHTRVTIYILSLTMKKQELDIENYFIVFRNILLDGEYTFAFVQTIYQSSFSNLLGTPP